MKIAQIAPIAESVPPGKYGGTERVVASLTEGLVKKGHDVTLFATAESQTSAHLVSVIKSAQRTLPKDKIVDSHTNLMLHLATAYDMGTNFDIIHDHTGTHGAAIAHLQNTPTVFTVHNVVNPETSRFFTHISNPPPLVSISQQQRKINSRLSFAETIYNGLDFSSYPFGANPGKYLIFVGRICPQKGTHYAIEVARQTHLPLIIAAKYEPEIAKNKKYFTQYIEPYLSDDIRFIGEVSTEKRNELFAHAKASLHPATWEEPFGLTLIEAMACGCPVVAFDHGAIPEIIQNGISGYIVHTMAEMSKAVQSIDYISREQCALYARTAFNADQMVYRYERLYDRIIHSQKKY